tara:strand:- start:864 stop:1028 length:165 start_codon:yes stop_codon:yes gene_type:complete
MSKKDIIKKYKGNWWSGIWLNRYLAKRTTKVKHKNQNKEDDEDHLNDCGDANEY